MTHPTDDHVGRQIRLRRKAVGQSQQALAADLGVSFQQVQKYERGTNRVSASMLVEVAKSQGSPVGYYFEGLDMTGGAVEELPGVAAARAWLGTSDAWDVAQAVAPMNPTAQHAIARGAVACARALEACFDPTITVEELDAEGLAEALRKGGLRVDVIPPTPAP